MTKIAYALVQCTWGILQSLAGLVIFFLNRKQPHYFFHGAVVTEWKDSASVSLGIFIFVTERPFFCEKFKNRYTMEELASRLLVHEYGHTIQSLLLGPFYLILMGIPSFLWANLRYFARKRREQQISYFSFFTERWANRLGEQVTNLKSMEQLVID